MLRFFKDTGPALGAWLLAAALELSGLSNPVIAGALAVVGVWLLTIPAVAPVRKWLASRRPGDVNIPRRVIALAAIGAFALAGIVWLSPKTPTLTPLGYMLLFAAVLIALVATWLTYVQVSAAPPGIVRGGGDTLKSTIVVGPPSDRAYPELVPIEDAARRAFEETGVYSDWPVSGEERLRSHAGLLVIEAHTNPDLLRIWGVQLPSVNAFKRVPPELLLWKNMAPEGTSIRIERPNDTREVDWIKISVEKSDLAGYFSRLRTRTTAGQAPANSIG